MSDTKSGEVKKWPSRVSPSQLSHLVHDGAQHCGQTDRRLAHVRRMRLWKCTERVRTNPSRHLAPPRPPLWSGQFGAEADAPDGRPLALVRPLNPSVLQGGARGQVQVFGWDQRLLVLLFRYSKHWNTDVVTITWELTTLHNLATLNLTQSGGGRARAGLWRWACSQPRPLQRVFCLWKEAKTRSCESWEAQVAGGVEAPLPLRVLRERVGGVADGRIRKGSCVCLGLQVDVWENLPAVPSAVRSQTGWSLKWDVLWLITKIIVSIHY